MTLILSDKEAVKHQEYTHWRDVLACTYSKRELKQRANADYISTALGSSLYWHAASPEN